MAGIAILVTDPRAEKEHQGYSSEAPTVLVHEDY
jgi:hypothetical protein